MRIGLIHITQETNDFNPALTDLATFRSFGIVEGDAIVEQLTGIGQVGGFIEVANAAGAEIVPIIRGFSLAGGRISREAYDYFHERISTGLKAAGPLDGLALQLHGACAAEGVDDVEGEQAALCRSILGPDVPIVLGLDHHANVTRKMVTSVDAIAAHRTQPHDTYDTGKVGTELLLRIMRDGARPVTAWRKIPMISHQEQFLTRQPPMKVWFDRAREMEAADPAVMQVSPIPIQPWLDVAEGGWTVVVVTDGDRALADRLADEMADLAWSMRADFQVSEAIPVDDAVRKADAAEKGIVVLSDTGDTVFGGAAGDSNVILEAMLRLGITGRALVPMIAPKTIDRIWGCAVGDELTLAVGGETATHFFKPLEVTGTVTFVGDGPIDLVFNHQRQVNMGRRLILEIGPVTLLMTELRGVAGNLPGVYSASGVDVSAHKMAVMKTASNFQYFDSVSSEVIRVASPGPGQSDLAALPWRRLPRPIYPFDPIDDWRDGPVKTAGA